MTRSRMRGAKGVRVFGSFPVEGWLDAQARHARAHAGLAGQSMAAGGGERIQNGALAWLCGHQLTRPFEHHDEARAAVGAPARKLHR